MKKIVLCFLILVSLLWLCSCDSAESGVVIENKRVVALAKESSSYIPTIEYCEQNGYSYVTYESISDAVNAVDNGKAEYVVLEVSEYNSSYFATNELTIHEKVEYEIGFCAVFNIENEKLYNDFDNAIKELKVNGTLEKVKKAYYNNEFIDTPASKDYGGKIEILCSPVFDERVCYNSEGELTGVDVALCEAICRYLGYSPQFVERDFDELFSELEKGNGDVIFSSVEYTEERNADYLLTDFYDTREFNVYKRK